MERIKAQTAHEEHILEFKAMCSDMINEMAPEIKRECMEECKNEIKKEQDSSRKRTKEPEVQFHLNMKDIEKQVRKAFARAFK